MSLTQSTSALSSLLTASILHWAVLVVPGANVLLVMQLSASGHRRAACCAGLGITLVAGIWAVLAIAGLHLLLVSHPDVKSGLQTLGGLYLWFVAARIWLSNSREDEDRFKSIGSIAALRLGFLTNILNPKAALFFGSVFVTALPSEPSIWLQTSMVCLVLVNALVWHLLLAYAFSLRRVQDGYLLWRVPIAGGTAVVLALFGLGLMGWR